jgi:hypothetical protein
MLLEICALCDVRDRRKLVVHTDNAKRHVAKRIKRYLDDNNLKSAPYFALLPRLLQGTEFQTAEESVDGVVRILADIPLETLMVTFHEWLQRLQGCIDGDGEYVE